MADKETLTRAFKYRCYPVNQKTVKYINSMRYWCSRVQNELLNMAENRRNELRNALDAGLIPPKPQNKSEISIWAKQLPEEYQHLARGYSPFSISYDVPAARKTVDSIEITKERPMDTSRFHTQSIHKGPVRNLARAYDTFFDSAKQSMSMDRGQQKTESGIRKDGKPKGYPKHKKFHEVTSLHFSTREFAFNPNRQRVDICFKKEPVASLRIPSYKQQRQLPSDPIDVMTIHIDSCNKYWVIFKCKDIPIIDQAKTGNSVGIDMGITNIIADSFGNIVKNPRFHVVKKPDGAVVNLSKKSADLASRKDGLLTQIKKLQRDSEERKPLVKKIRNIQKNINLISSRVSNRRKDFHNKLALRMVREYDMIALEDLAVKEITKNKDQDGRKGETRKTEQRRHHELKNVALSELRQQIKNAAELHNKQVILVDPAYTSKTCSQCGHIKSEMKLSDRTFDCEKCGYSEDRDVNAAKNILTKAMDGRVSRKTHTRSRNSKK